MANNKIITKQKSRELKGRNFQGVDFIKQLVRDIKINGIGLLKSEVVVKQVRELEPDIEISYSKEERLYTAYYKKEFKDDGSD
jgi:hypothetical protein